MDILLNIKCKVGWLTPFRKASKIFQHPLTFLTENQTSFATSFNHVSFTKRVVNEAFSQDDGVFAVTMNKATGLAQAKCSTAAWPYIINVRGSSYHRDV